MDQGNDSADLHFTAFRSAWGQPSNGKNDLVERRNEDCSISDQAVYFSRRAREELQAGINGGSRKVRETHFALAEAYEFRARVLTDQLLRRGAVQQCHAL